MIRLKQWCESEACKQGGGVASREGRGRQGGGVADGDSAHLVAYERSKVTTGTTEL